MDKGLLLIWLIAACVLTFVIWGVDKYRAATGGWRVPERWLFTLTVFGGAFGALAGMVLFRHKTRKPNFWLAVGGMCLVHALVLALI